MRFKKIVDRQYLDFLPTTRPALSFPSWLEEFTPAGIAEAAIFVILIELVFVARIALGFNSAANDANMDCLSGKDSETAWFEKSIFEVVFKTRCKNVPQ